MELSALPNELIQEVSRQLSSERDVNALARVNQRFHGLLNGSLYRLNVARVDEWPDHVLMWAARHGRVETIIRAEALGITAPAPRMIYEAAASGSMSVVEFLFERVCREGEPPDIDSPPALLFALENEHFDIFRFFIDHGANVDSISPSGRTSLHAAAHFRYLAEADLLLEHGADLEPVDLQDHTPLHYACRNGSVDVAELLLDRGSDIEARDIDGFAPLHLAAREGRLGAIEMLIRWGADINALDDEGWTPLLVAVESGQLEASSLLVHKGAAQ